MKSSVDAKAFSDALKKAGGILKKSYFRVLEEIRVDFEEGKCTVTATNFAMWMTIELPAVGDSFSFMFSNTIKVMKACQYYDGTLTFSLSGDVENPLLNMSCGRRAGEFTVLITEIYPVLPEAEETREYRTNAAALLERVNRIQYAATKSEQRPAFEGVRFQDCRLWCVDGCRVALNTHNSLFVENPFIVPVPALKQLKVFGKADVEIAVGKRYVRISGAGITLYSRLLEPSDNLQLDSVIPIQMKEHYQVERKQYLDALNYLEVNLYPGDKPYVNFHNGSLTLDTSSAKYCASLDMDCACEIEYAFDLRHMKDALGQFPGDDFVDVQATGILSPIVLTNGKDNTAMVLPVRMRDNSRSSAA